MWRLGPSGEGVVPGSSMGATEEVDMEGPVGVERRISGITANHMPDEPVGATRFPEIFLDGCRRDAQNLARDV